MNRKTYSEVSKKIDALVGTHVVMPDVSTAKKKIDEGYSFIAYSIDTLFLEQSCRDGLGEIYNAFKAPKSP